MSTFKNIEGKNIRSYANNAPNATAGEMWYNQSEVKLKGVVSLQAWSSTSNVNTNRTMGSGFGLQTATVAAGGLIPPNTYQSISEEYNGSGWTAGGALGTARRSQAGLGVLTAGLIFGGYNGAGGPGDVADSESYNGSSFSEGNNLNTARSGLGAFGTQTAGVGAAGSVGPAGQQLVEEYNGTSWSEETNINGTAKWGLIGAGTQTAGVVFGGNSSPGMLKETEEYDGSSWTTSGNMNTARGEGSGGGTQTAAITYAGRQTGPGSGTTATELYDGTTWATSPATLATACAFAIMGSTGTQTASLNATGSTGPSGAGPLMTTAQEYHESANAITGAAWASGGALGTARYQIGGAGDLPAGLAYGGYSAPSGTINKTEEYNGTTWSEVNDMANTRGQCSGQHIGTQTAALAIGGYLTTSPNYGALCEEYDGTNWTTGGALTEDSGRSYIAGFGTQTAAVAGGGYAQTGAVSNSEHYDGSSWTAGNNMQATAYAASGTGTQTAGLAVGDYPAGSDVEEYDGTNWTTVTAYPTGRFGVYGGMGTQTDSIHAGGSASTTRTTETFGYDGTSWSTRPSLANALSSGASGGTSTSAFIAGGRGSPPGPTAGVTTTEEFTGETSALNIVDITTS